MAHFWTNMPNAHSIWIQSRHVRTCTKIDGNRAGQDTNKYSTNHWVLGCAMCPSLNLALFLLRAACIHLMVCTTASWADSRLQAAMCHVVATKGTGKQVNASSEWNYEKTNHHKKLPVFPFCKILPQWRIFEADTSSICPLDEYKGTCETQQVQKCFCSSFYASGQGLNFAPNLSVPQCKIACAKVQNCDFFFMPLD